MTTIPTSVYVLSLLDINNRFGKWPKKYGNFVRYTNKRIKTQFHIKKLHMYTYIYYFEFNR